MHKKGIIISWLLTFGFVLYGQQVIVKGKVVDFLEQPLSKVQVHCQDKVLTTDKQGQYQLELPQTAQTVSIIFSKKGYQDYQTTLAWKDEDSIALNVLLTEENTVDEVVFSSKVNEIPISSIEIKPADIEKISSLSGGVEEALKLNPFVNSNTELSSQYMVRGGSYDENLVYINGMELYRPQLIRSGRQEGLSFLNPSMVQMVNFSAGGFEAKYGDKMSSVLDILYKQPHAFEGSLEADFMGGNLTVGYGTPNRSVSGIVGIRYSDKSLLVDTQDDDVDYDPTYFDVQSNWVFKLSDQWKLNVLTNFTQNTISLIPKSRETIFGSVGNLYKLTVDYQGNEEDLFQHAFGTVSAIYTPNRRLTNSFEVSAFHSLERTYTDIQSTYLLGSIDPQSGAYTSTYDLAGQIDHVRNDLDLLVLSLQHRGKYAVSHNSDLEWGVKWAQESIDNRWNEFHRIDSAGYLLPVSTTNSAYWFTVPYISTTHDIRNHRLSVYAQYTEKKEFPIGKLMYNAGMRMTYFSFNDQTTFSPRGQIAFKPHWEKDMLFRLAAGIYYQTPFFRDMLDVYGNLNPTIKSQKSIHFIAGNDYEFSARDHRFKLTTELYYKHLSEVIPYYIDNVRVVYMGENNAQGNQYGIDMRLNGNFSEGTESWLSVSYARAKWNIEDNGYMPMPTDPQFKIGLFYQDYMPVFPSMKVHLNLLYSSGLPNGAPLYTNPYNFSGKLNSYKRVDIGFTKTFIDQKNKKPQASAFWSKMKELSVGLEVFNLFDIENEISNLWTKDLYGNQYYSIPNRLTGRFITLKLWAKF